MSFLAWKLIHIASVVVFLGNIGTGVFWGAYAHRRADLGLLAATFEGIIRSDRWFTLPGVVGMIVSGIAMALIAGHPLLGTGWILWPIVLISASGLAFHFWVAPLQRRVRDAALAGDQPTSDALYRQWGIWGVVALATPIAALVIMVMKPTLPAF